MVVPSLFALNDITKLWYSEHNWLRILTPFSWVVSGLAEYRRTRFKYSRGDVWHAPVPVCVVGNITVGGTGKTPLVIWLTEWLSRRGINVGIVSRGYGGRASKYPITVDEQSHSREVGEENILLYRRTQVPVVVDPNRVHATQFLLENNTIDIVIADDGLQHYRLGRTIEIAVLDGYRGIGNGMLLPFGPLREPKKRLQEVDWVVVKNEPRRLDTPASVMELNPVEFVNIATDSVLAKNEFCTRYPGPVRAIAAIGNPQSFQHTLDSLELEAKVEAFQDHHYFRVEELLGDDTVVVVTEKDAQKIRELSMDSNHIWYLRVEAKFRESVDAFLTSLFRQHGLSLDTQN